VATEKGWTPRPSATVAGRCVSRVVELVAAPRVSCQLAKNEERIELFLFRSSFFVTERQLQHLGQVQRLAPCALVDLLAAAEAV
jgi:hypothetical protein